MSVYQCLGLLSLTLFGIGQAVADEEDYDELDQVVVSATRWEEPGVSSASSIKVITREQILQSGVINIIDILKTQAGIQIQDLFGDGSRATVSLRGFGNNGGSNTLLLVDGRRLNNTDLKTPDISFISLKDVERIEVVQGSASILYGDQAVGGAINIITRKTDDLALAGELGVGSYSNDLQRVNAANRFANGIGFRTSAERRDTDNYRNQNELEYFNFFSMLDYEWQRGRVFAEWIHVDEELNTPGAIFPEQIVVNRKAIGPFSLGDFNETESDTARFGGTFRLGELWDIAIEYTHRNEDIDGAISSTSFNQHRLARSLNPRLRGTVFIGEQDVNIVAGADIERTEYKIISGVGDTVNNQQMNAIYSQLTWNIRNNISIIGGLRYANLKNSSFKRDPFAAFPLPIDTFVNKVNKDNQTANSLGFVYKPLSNWRLFAKRETSFRFPLADELTGTEALFDDLETQTGVSYEAGLEWSSSNIQTRVVGYQLELDDEIAFDQSLNFGVGANINFDPTTRTGTIAELNMQPLAELDIGISYAYVDGEFDRGQYEGNRIPLVADHQLNINTNYNFTPWLSLYGEAIFISDRIAGSDLSNTFPDLPGYGIGNLNLRLEKNGFSMSARVNNILDKKYSTSAALGFSPFVFGTDTGYFTAPERNFLLSISYNYEN